MIFDPEQDFKAVTTTTKKPIALPFSEIEEARKHISVDTSIPVREGELVQISPKTTGEGHVLVPNRNIPELEVKGELDSRLDSWLLRITEVQDGIGSGEPVSKADISVDASERPDWVKKAQKATKSNRTVSNQTTNRYPRKHRDSKGRRTKFRKNLNELLKGKL